MPIKRKYNAQLLGEYWLAIHPLTGKEIIASTEEMAADRAIFKELKFLLFDITRLNSVDMPTSEVLRLAEVDLEASLTNPDLRVVGVAANDLIFGIGRMWEAYTDEIPWKRYFCRTLKEAAAWIENEYGGGLQADDILHKYPFVDSMTNHED